MATRDADYTKTGNGWLASLANKISFVPVIGGAIAAPMLLLDSGITAIGWAFRGNFASAATAMGTGAAAAATTAMPFYWPVNVISGITTGRSVQTHVRGLTETATSFVTKPLGMQPTVLRSHYAGIGGVGSAALGQTGPGRFTSQVANERGQDANAMYANYMRGEGGVHVNQLASANGRGA